ncbi:hypothetical protein H0H87_000124 [Tephrocybe sp. NHM501043]|nr:hypothetical protein H0H87_000124 [Tephrocybe sp. NHM501043]
MLTWTRQPIGTSANWFGKTQYEAKKPIAYRSCVLRIKRKGHLLWNGLQLGSGFIVELQYTKKLSLPGEVIGLNDDYDLTPPLARFFELNRNLIEDWSPHVEEVLGDYRRHNRKEIKFHIGKGSTERDMMEVDLETRIGQASSIGTGAGTDHDDSWIRTRPQYRWEGILTDSPSPGNRRGKWLSKLSAWLGLTPTWRSGIPTDELLLDVRQDNGRYVLLNSEYLLPCDTGENVTTTTTI